MTRNMLAISFFLLTLSTLKAQNEEVGIAKFESKEHNTLAIEYPIIIYWDSIKLTRNSVEYVGKETYLDDNEFYIVFEDLINGTYTIEHKSDFKEIYKYTINLESDTILSFPNKKLKYEVVDIEDKDLKGILESKQLQLQITELGCHHLNKYYVELYNGSNYKGSQEQSAEKIILTNEEFNERISNLVLNAKTDDSCNDYTCSDIYTLKAGHKLYSFYDCCVSKELIQMLRRGTEANTR